MRRVLIVLVALVLCLAIPGPAGALSCARPYRTPQEALQQEDFFEHYDFVVLGRRTTRRINREPGDNHGDTVDTFEVAAVLGAEKAGDTIEIRSLDPGWLSGYGFQRGHAYFVPVKRRDSDGRPYDSFACDPIFELDDLDAAVAELAPTESEPQPEPEEPEEAGLPVVPVAAGGGALILVGALLRPRLRRRSGL